MKPQRKIIQLAPMSGREELYALCNDGTVWCFNHDGQWREWPPPIPQPDKKDFDNTPKGAIKL